MICLSILNFLCFSFYFDVLLKKKNIFLQVGEWDRLFPSWERNLIVYAGAYAMWLIGKRLKKR